MPNWCECDLYVEGPKAKVGEFLEHAKGDESRFDFNRFISYPEHFAALDRAFEEWYEQPPETRGEYPKDGYNQGGYEWCISNWGTKWNACRVEVQELCPWNDEAGVEINFDTAWGPPLPVIARASELFPELRFDLRYYECGCGFHGKFACEGGEVVADESGDYFGNRGG